MLFTYNTALLASTTRHERVSAKEHQTSLGMVQFGNYLSTHRVPGWEPFYIDYKILKKMIKRYEGVELSGSIEEQEDAVRLFSQDLDSQVEKIVLFFLEQQGVLAARLQNLRETQEFDEESLQTVDHIEEAMERYRKVAKDLLQLLHFLEMNATGIRKILKKFDRRVGFHLGRMYIQSRTEHPYSQLEQVFRQVGLGALVATIIRNLGELQTRQRASQDRIEGRPLSFSLFGAADAAAALVEEEPIIREIQAAQAKLTKAVSFYSYVANELLLPETTEEVTPVSEFHWWSLQLNLINTFLYMANYYIVVPTSDTYAMILEAPPSLCGAIIGCMPLCALISSLLYSHWSNSSYSHPLISSTGVLLIGNVLYAMAFDKRAIWMLLLGRAMAGLGGARAINRRYISDHVPLSMRTASSAAFVSASALGMAAGPAAAGILNTLDFKILGFTVNNVTSPGWLMALLWALYLILLLVLFKEPNKKHGAEGPITRKSSQPKVGGEAKGSIGGVGGGSKGDLERPLLLGGGSSSHPESQTPSEKDDEEEDTIRPVESFADLARELTVPVQILLFVYFMIKFAQEVLVSESSLVTKLYFDWNVNDIGVFLATLGATVLPMSAFVGNYVSNIYEDRLVLLWTQGVTVLGILGILSFSPLIPYSNTQYILSAIIIYVAANVTEGVNMSLLSKVMSPALSRGTFNCGLLSTEAGTLARVVGDGMITLMGAYFGIGNVLNFTMLPVLTIAVASLALTKWRYWALFG